MPEQFRLSNTWQKTFLLSVIILLLWMLGANESSAQNANAKMADMLRRLASQNTFAYIAFQSPIAGENGWFVPEDLIVDGQSVGQRVIDEVGDDYVCLANVGVTGGADLSCIPFANIAYVSFDR